MDGPVVTNKSPLPLPREGIERFGVTYGDIFVSYSLLYHFPERGLKPPQDLNLLKFLLSPLPLPREGIETFLPLVVCIHFGQSPLPLPREGIETFSKTEI